MADRLPAQEKTGLESRPEMSLAFFDSELFAALKPYLSRQIKPGIGEFYALNLEGIKKAAAHWRVTSREAMIFCLQNDVWPLRFSRNRGILQAFEQAKLLETEVAIIGCGGLGGHLLALLARLGIGAFNLCDGDFLEESNLNRQLLCREDNLGQNKAEAAAQFLSQVASHALARVFPQKASETSLPEIIGSSRLVLDGLDNVAGRLILEIGRAHV